MQRARFQKVGQQGNVADCYETCPSTGCADRIIFISSKLQKFSFDKHLSIQINYI